jgi:hypothetical protein
LCAYQAVRRHHYQGLRGYVVWHGGRDLFIFDTLEMKDYAVAFLAAVCLIATVLWAVFILVWVWYGHG